jgi:hypothetical protein
MTRPLIQQDLRIQIMNFHYDGQDLYHDSIHTASTPFDERFGNGGEWGVPKSTRERGIGTTPTASRDNGGDYTHHHLY